MKKKIIALAIAIGALAITAQSSMAGGCSSGYASYTPSYTYSPTYTTTACTSHYVVPTYTYTTPCYVQVHKPFYTVKVKIGCNWFIKYSGFELCQANSVASFYQLHGHPVQIWNK